MPREVWVAFVMVVLVLTAGGFILSATENLPRGFRWWHVGIALLVLDGLVVYMLLVRVVVRWFLVQEGT